MCYDFHWLLLLLGLRTFFYALVIDHSCVPRGQQLSAMFGGEADLV